MFRLFSKIRFKLLDEQKVSKYASYALGEIVLVIIGILIALQINIWNETRKDQQQIAKYARSLIIDLQADVEMLETVLRTAEAVTTSSEELVSYMWQRDIEDVDNLRLVYHTTFVSYRPYSWNLSTFHQLTSSAAYRQIKNDQLARLITEYETASRHLDHDYMMDLDRGLIADQLANEIVDSTFPNREIFRQLTWGSDSGYQSELWEAAYAESQATLLTDDPARLRAMVNSFKKLGNQVSVRVDRELPEHIERARALIELLEAEYPEAH